MGLVRSPLFLGVFRVLGRLEEFAFILLLGLLIGGFYVVTAAEHCAKM